MCHQIKPFMSVPRSQLKRHIHHRQVAATTTTTTTRTLTTTSVHICGTLPTNAPVWNLKAVLQLYRTPAEFYLKLLTGVEPNNWIPTHLTFSFSFYPSLSLSLSFSLCTLLDKLSLFPTILLLTVWYLNHALISFISETHGAWSIEMI